MGATKAPLCLRVSVYWSKEGRCASEGHREHKQQLANSRWIVWRSPDPTQREAGTDHLLLLSSPYRPRPGEGRLWMCVRSGPCPQKAVALAVVLCVSIGWTEGVRQPHPPPAGSQDGLLPPGQGPLGQFPS